MRSLLLPGFHLRSRTRPRPRPRLLIFALASCYRSCSIFLSPDLGQLYLFTLISGCFLDLWKSLISIFFFWRTLERRCFVSLSLHGGWLFLGFPSRWETPLWGMEESLFSGWFIFPPSLTSLACTCTGLHTISESLLFLLHSSPALSYPSLSSKSIRHTHTTSHTPHTFYPLLTVLSFLALSFPWLRRSWSWFYLSRVCCCLLCSVSISFLEHTSLCQCLGVPSLTRLFCVFWSLAF
jgi:hypothetical protein